SDFRRAAPSDDECDKRRDSEPRRFPHAFWLQSRRPPRAGFDAGSSVFGNGIRRILGHFIRDEPRIAPEACSTVDIEGLPGDEIGVARSEVVDEMRHLFGRAQSLDGASLLRRLEEAL